MKKHLLTTVAASLILAFVHPAEAQQQAKVRKIGWLGTRPASGPGSGIEALRRELHALGWVEGKNIAFEQIGLTIPPNLLARADKVIR
jgi:hypothetical protein